MMFDKELIKKICDVTCLEDEVRRNQTTIKYDTQYPFKKYFSLDSIVKAIGMYTSNKWNDITLASWFCIYNWIICGGFSDDLKEDLTPLEELLKEVISWDLDGLSFFDVSMPEGNIDFRDDIQLFKDFLHILNTINDWRCYYACVGLECKWNNENYIVLINDKTKEYMIISSSFLEIEYSDDIFHHLKDKEFVQLTKELKSKKYKSLSHSEYWYNQVIKEEYANIDF